MDAVLLLFDPDHPHCTLCDGHINMPGEDFVLAGLVSPEGQHAVAIVHVECAKNDDQMRAVLRERIDRPTPSDHPGYVN